MNWVLYLVATLAGVLSAFQSGQNATLKSALGLPLLAAFIVTGLNLIVYAAAIPFAGLGWPSAGKLAAVPWWAWFGGICGGLYILALIFTADKLGSGIFTGLTVTAALITSIALDHFGLVGFKVHEASVWRVFGAALMIGGVMLICAF